jgi:hypothetical protein
MSSLYEIFKTPSGPSTGKALLNHTIFSPSQTGETVPLIREIHKQEFTNPTANVPSILLGLLDRAN